MSDQLKSIFFAAATAVICSLLLSGASVGLSGYKMRNIALDRQKNILLAAGLIHEDGSYLPENIEKIFSENIRTCKIDAAGRIISEKEGQPNQLPVSLYMKNGEVFAYIIPIDTQGLWGKIHGYLALEKDGSTIIGFTVYKHSETPGLGGEIEKAWFSKNFKGKKIVDRTGNFVSISIARGKVSQGIS
ncbi:FMN-binding protein, partial [Desulfobacterales bacterium HSG16]|nr:FMN-binding protein [Desulfobacterales bacterium HSG16]